MTLLTVEFIIEESAAVASLLIFGGGRRGAKLLPIRIRKDMAGIARHQVLPPVVLWGWLLGVMKPMHFLTIVFLKAKLTCISTVCKDSRLELT